MKKIKIITLISLLLTIITACGTVKEGFTNQKKKSTDEFLVEKKAPLVMPPNFNELPIPKKKNIQESNKSEEVKKLINKSKKKYSSNNNLKKIDKTDGSLEKSILKKIKK